MKKSIYWSPWLVLCIVIFVGLHNVSAEQPQLETELTAKESPAGGNKSAENKFTKTYEKPYVQVKTPAGIIRLSSYGAGIVRTQVFDEAKFLFWTVSRKPEKRWNPAVIASPKASGFSFTEGDNQAVFETAKLKVVVDKKSGQIMYYDTAGKLLTQTAAASLNTMNIAVSLRSLSYPKLSIFTG